jgi:hypothetical protein
MKGRAACTLHDMADVFMTRCEGWEVTRRRHIVGAKRRTARDGLTPPHTNLSGRTGPPSPAACVAAQAGYVTSAVARSSPCSAFYPPTRAAWTPRVCVCDLNAPLLPERYLCLSNIVYLLGVIEYIQDLPRLFTALASRAETIVVSYNCTNLGEADRSSYGWVNALASQDVLALLGDTGFHTVAIERVGTMEIVVKAENLRFGLYRRLRRRAARLCAWRA